MNTLNTEIGNTDNEFSSMISDIANSDKMGLQISSYDKANGASFLTKREFPIWRKSVTCASIVKTKKPDCSGFCFIGAPISAVNPFIKERLQ